VVQLIRMLSGPETAEALSPLRTCNLARHKVPRFDRLRCRSAPRLSDRPALQAPAALSLIWADQISLSCEMVQMAQT